MRELFADTAAKLFADHVSTAVIADAEDGRWPDKLWQAIEAAGLPIALAAEEHGGIGASWGDTLAIVLAAGEHAAPVPLCETLVANWALSQAGLDVLEGPATIAPRHALVVDQGKVSGVAHDVPWGGLAHNLLFVQAGDTPTLNVVRCGDASVESLTNIAREPRDGLTFDHAEIVVSAPLPAGSSDILKQAGALVRAAQIAGGLAHLLDLTIGYANERIQFGRSIGKFQVIQHRIAVLASQAALANAAVDQAFTRTQDQPTPFDVAVAKCTAGAAASQCATIAHAVHGAIGFTYEHSLQLTTRRLWSWRDEFGSEAAWGEHLGQAACAVGSAALWPGIIGSGFAD